MKYSKLTGLPKPILNILLGVLETLLSIFELYSGGLREHKYVPSTISSINVKSLDVLPSPNIIIRLFSKACLINIITV